ncbi:MAG: efflux RND transporter periplasmic adaptor subunit, partial [Firmicutes bacterium]|nr:efflux RND transporter periplasmic adaptor subunit [Bacillota bacterium]
MKFKWKLWLVPLAAALAFGLFKGGDIWGRKKEAPPDVHIQTVVTSEVAKVKKENTLVLTGTLEALDEAAVSPKVAGRVSRVLVENGAAVAAGEPLVFLENTEFNNLLAVNQAALKKAEANLAAVRSNYERFKELYEAGAVSKKDFEDVETGLKVAEAEAGSAAAALANAEESLRNTTITSP